MSSLSTHLDPVTPIFIGETQLKVKKVTLRQLFRLLALVDKVKADLGMTRADLEGTDLNAEGIANLIAKIVTVCVGEVNFDLPATELSPVAKLVLGELGSLVGVSADQMADAELNELHAAVMAFWEANANSPLGEKIQATIAKLIPMVSLAKDVVMTGFQRELMRALPVGGMRAGGTTGSSSPSSESSDGPSDTSSTTSPPDESSSSLSPSDSLESSKMLESEELLEVTGPNIPQAPEPESQQAST